MFSKKKQGRKPEIKIKIHNERRVALNCFETILYFELAGQKLKDQYKRQWEYLAYTFRHLSLPSGETTRFTITSILLYQETVGNSIFTLLFMFKIQLKCAKILFLSL